MKCIIRLFMVVVLAAGAAGCGSSPGSGPGAPTPEFAPVDPVDLNARFARHAVMEDEVMALAGSRWRVVPDSGAANFRGISTMRIGTETAQTADDISLIGFARMNADFATGQMTGDIIDVEGYSGPVAGATTVFDTAGAIVIGAGGGSQLAAALPNSRLDPNTFVADYAGTLRSPLGDIVVGGEMSGRFRGTISGAPADDLAIKGLAASDNFPVFSVDGIPRAGSMSVVAKALR